MAYTNDPRAPKVRRDAAAFALKQGVRVAARRFGVSPGTITKWMQKAKRYGANPIPTGSSRPRSHPDQLSRELSDAIADKRVELKRSAEVIHRALAEDGVVVSLSSVKRTLDRRFLLKKRSPWKRYHPPTERPVALYPGALVEVDTVHLAVQGKTVLYVFTLIDVYSRWAYARAYAKANTQTAAQFVKQAQVAAPFLFECIQTDNGSEFSTHFTERIQIRHRHTRVRQSNDNAHIERFNRTLREECMDALPVDLFVLNRTLPSYLERYNTIRHHFGLNLSTPLKYLKCFQAID